MHGILRLLALLVLGFGISVLIQHLTVATPRARGVGDYCIADAALLVALARTLCHHIPSALMTCGGLGLCAPF